MALAPRLTVRKKKEPLLTISQNVNVRIELLILQTVSSAITIQILYALSEDVVFDFFQNNIVKDFFS